jgi:hypothetical protein
VVNLYAQLDDTEHSASMLERRLEELTAELEQVTAESTHLVQDRTLREARAAYAQAADEVVKTFHAHLRAHERLAEPEQALIELERGSGERTPPTAPPVLKTGRNAAFMRGVPYGEAFNAHSPPLARDSAIVLRKGGLGSPTPQLRRTAVRAVRGTGISIWGNGFDCTRAVSSPPRWSVASATSTVTTWAHRVWCARGASPRIRHPPIP